MRSCVVTVAPDMGDKTFGYLVTRIKAHFGEDVNVLRVNDADVIGGFYMELDGTVYDMTIRTQLNKLREEDAK